MSAESDADYAQRSLLYPMNKEVTRISSVSSYRYSPDGVDSAAHINEYKRANHGRELWSPFLIRGQGTCAQQSAHDQVYGWHFITHNLRMGAWLGSIYHQCNGRLIPTICWWTLEEFRAAAREAVELGNCPFCVVAAPEHIWWDSV